MHDEWLNIASRIDYSREERVGRFATIATANSGRSGSFQERDVGRVNYIAIVVVEITWICMISSNLRCSETHDFPDRHLDFAVVELATVFCIGRKILR